MSFTFTTTHLLSASEDSPQVRWEQSVYACLQGGQEPLRHKDSVPFIFSGLQELNSE